MSGAIKGKLVSGQTVAGWTVQPDGRFTDDVWRVRHHDGRIGVIKTARGKRKPWPERFAHEVNTVDLLQKLPGALRLLDRDPDVDATWMITEEAVGLATHLGPAPDVGAVVSAFADIADTLVEAATDGIAHRDLKPDNLFHARGRAVVGDFGLATGHDHAGLTAHGSRVGPSNFCAPEALQASETTDWFAADVYAFAKTLWVAAVGTQTYPPQGPLSVRRRTSDLLPHAGRASEDLARLLEIATADLPGLRPSMADVRDELRTWLRLHPPGTTDRPDPATYRSAFDEFLSARAIDEGGPTKIVDAAAHALLHRCRSAHASGSRLVKDPNANINPTVDPRSHGDPDWAPEVVAVMKLGWDGAAGVRLVVVAVLDGDDDLRYDLSWQVRNPGTTNWTITFRAAGRARMRLPSDADERARLADDALRNVPAQLQRATAHLDTRTEATLRQVVTGIRRREAMRSNAEAAAEQDAATRLDAAETGRNQLRTLWDNFAAHLNSVTDDDLPTRTVEDRDTWFLTLGDRRIVINIEKPSEPHNNIALVGTLVVETEHPDAFKSHVANVCALIDASGDPVWQLIRFNRNNLAPNPVAVREALHDGAGAVAPQLVPQLLQAPTSFPHVPAASIASRDLLNVDHLLALVVDELRAIDERS